TTTSRSTEALRSGNASWRNGTRRSTRSRGARTASQVTVDARYAFLLRLARDAGKVACDFWIRRAALTVELKGTQDFVSVADREVEMFIRDQIARAFPGDHFRS